MHQMGNVAIGFGAGNREIWACPTSYTRGCRNSPCRTLGQRLCLAERGVLEGIPLEIPGAFGNDIHGAASVINLRRGCFPILAGIWASQCPGSGLAVLSFAGKIGERAEKGEGTTVGQLIYESLITQISRERALTDISPILRIRYGSNGKCKVLLPGEK